VNFQLTEEQSALVAAVQEILQDHSALPQSARLQSYWYNAELQRLLAENGYLAVGRELGRLEAALVVIEAAKVPAVTEVSASSLVTPQILGNEVIEGPVALLSGRDLRRPHRNLPIARHALVDVGDDVLLLPVHADNVEPVASILAYPYGRFIRVPELRSARRLRHQGAKLRHWWRVALAAESTGAAQAAVAFTLNHVKQRHVFGHPIAAFQTVQHRIVQCHMVATALYFLSLRAAWSGVAYDAHVAGCYAQQNVKKIVVDLHQFTGAMGVTNEFALHLWTYRLRALQTEAGGGVEAALEVAHDRWTRRSLSEAHAGVDVGAELAGTGVK
jgi:alkylation response protein AidB-like acyl-CoA dehydrogenase